MGRFSNSSDSFLNSSGSGSRGFLGRVIALLVGAGAFVLSLVVGAVFLAAIVGFMLLIGLVMAARIWWVRRKMAQHQSQTADLEAEYTVITAEERIRSDKTRR